MPLGEQKGMLHPHQCLDSENDVALGVLQAALAGLHQAAPATLGALAFYNMFVAYKAATALAAQPHGLSFQNIIQTAPIKKPAAKYWITRQMSATSSTLMLIGAAPPHRTGLLAKHWS